MHLTRSCLLLCGLLLLCPLLLNAQISSTDSILRFWLAPQAVNDNQPAFRTFYFWTSLPDLDSCLTQEHLLRTAQPNDPLENSYRAALHSQGNEPIVNHLMSSDRQYLRNAWPVYWANINYDTASPHRQQLVQVVLMDSALIVSFFPEKKKKECWQVHDLSGHLLTMEDALERKRHIAAVFISGKEKIVFKGPRRAVFHEQYRTFLLCNESMIKSWHHAVPGLQAKIQKDFDYLLLLHAWLEKPEHCAVQGPKGTHCSAAWTKLSARMNVWELFFAAQQRAGTLAPPASQNTTKTILDAMRERFPAQMMPCERFPGVKR